MEFHGEYANGMKNELYEYHYEKVIDKPYAERVKAKPNIFVTMGLSFLPNITAIGLFLIKDMNPVLLFFIVYFNTISATMINGCFDEYRANKRFYAWTCITTGVILFVTIALWFIGAGGLHITPGGFVLLASLFVGLIFVVIILYIIARMKITKEEEIKNCNIKIQAVCVAYRSEWVDRFVDNLPHQRIERVKSPAYGSEKVELFTPIFKYVRNGVDYLTSPNFQRSDKPWIIGNHYEIYIDQNNPDECRF